MFAPMILGAAVGGAASCLSLLHHYRQQLGPMTVREARLLARLPQTPIAEAPGQGLVRLCGRVGALTTETSYYHRAPCAALELLHYQVVGTMRGPQRLLTRTDRFHRPFWVEDDSGRLLVDPATARIDYEIEGIELDSTVEERRIRVGERVAVLGIVHKVGPQLAQPMRQAAGFGEGGFALSDGALISWRSEPEVLPRLLPPAGGVVLSAGSAALAALGSMLDL